MRISKKDCEQLLEIIKIYIDEDFNISSAYGGYCLHLIHRPGTAVSDVFMCGHIPAKDLFYRMSAFIDGLRMGIKK